MAYKSTCTLFYKAMNRCFLKAGVLFSKQGKKEKAVTDKNVVRALCIKIT